MTMCVRVRVHLLSGARACACVWSHTSTQCLWTAKSFAALAVLVAQKDDSIIALGNQGVRILCY